MEKKGWKRFTEGYTNRVNEYVVDWHLTCLMYIMYIFMILGTILVFVAFIQAFS